MNISDFFLLRQFIHITDSLNKINLPSRIELGAREDIKLVIDTTINKANDVVFSFNFYRENKLVDISALTNRTVLFFLMKFELYVQNFTPLSEDSKELKFQTLLKYGKVSLTQMGRIIKEINMHNKILFLYLTSSLNIYTVNGFNNVTVSRTIIKSLDRINIVSSRVVNNEKLELLTNLHKLNITLVNNILHSNLSVFFGGLVTIITIVRIIMLMLWIISNLAIFSISTFIAPEPEIISTSFVAVNIVYPIVWLLFPRILVSTIKLKFKISQ